MTKYQRYTGSIKIASLVWLGYASADQIHRELVDSKTANRRMRQLNRSKTVTGVSIEGIYDVCHLSEKPKPISGRELEAEVSRHNLLSKPAHTTAIPFKRTRRVTDRVSFHAGKMQQDVMVFCQVTGIFGKLEFPSLPIYLSYEHPLAKAGNALTVIRALRKERNAEKLDRQVLAGLVLSLLGAKGLLRTQDDSTAVERNTVLQGCGVESLLHLCYLIEGYWDNPQVWKRMPGLNVSYLTHKEFPGTIGEAVTNYSKILSSILDPESLTQEDQARIFAAQRRKATGLIRNKIRVHSAAAVEERHIKESRDEIRDLFEILKPHLSIVQRTQVQNVVRNLLIMPTSSKMQVASTLRNAFIGMPQATPANDLAKLIENSSNEKLLSDIGSFTQETSPVKYKSIAEILAAKKGEQRGE